MAWGGGESCLNSVSSAPANSVVRAARSPEVFSNYIRASDGIEVDGKHVSYLRTVAKYDAPVHGPIRALAV
jgi:hypothetical protein